jgi:hypothetical protein
MLNVECVSAGSGEADPDAFAFTNTIQYLTGLKFGELKLKTHLHRSRLRQNPAETQLNFEITSI